MGKVYWSKKFGRNDAQIGGSLNLITITYSDALGNVLTKLLEKDHEILFCGDQKRYNGYIRRACHNAYININQEHQYECPVDEVDQNSLPYNINMVGQSWIDTVPMSDQNRCIVKSYIAGHTMKDIASMNALKENAISYRLKNITTVLSKHLPDIDITSRPCSFGSFVADARTFKRFKEDYVSWPVSKEKGFRVGKTRNQYKNLTTKTISMNLIASCPLPKDNDYALCDQVPLGETLQPEPLNNNILPCYAIAERMASRIPDHVYYDADPMLGGE